MFFFIIVKISNTMAILKYNKMQEKYAMNKRDHENMLSYVHDIESKYQELINRFGKVSKTLGLTCRANDNGHYNDPVAKAVSLDLFKGANQTKLPLYVNMDQNARQEYYNLKEEPREVLELDDTIEDQSVVIATQNRPLNSSRTQIRADTRTQRANSQASSSQNSSQSN